ncbi:MAG: N-acetyltransferase, partial [Bacilli bacterium]|nr:N-acetyltransferase [Bacilli bacterium]
MLNLYIPKIEDLWFRKQLLEDKETMSYNDKWGGTIPFPKELWQDYYNNWINKDPRNRFYC